MSDLRNKLYDRFESKYGDFYTSYDPERLKISKEASKQRRVAEAQATAKRKRKAKLKRKAYIRRIGALLVLMGVVLASVLGIKSCTAKHNTGTSSSSVVSKTQNHSPPETTKPLKVIYPEFSNDTVNLTDQLNSEHAILIDVDNAVVLADKQSRDKIYPASLVKLMTAIVAVENISDLDEKISLDQEVLSKLYNSDAIMIGLQEGEKLSVTDLFYGMIMFSGADAATALAIKAAGSVEDFVVLMNKKAGEMGLENTHFANVVGLDDESQYSTCYDLAIIMQQLLKNDFLRKVISTENYLIKPTESHPDGISLKNSMFAKMYGTEPEVATVKGGKTGFTNKAGFCLASYADANDGRLVIAVTTNSNGSYRPIYDCFELYKNYSLSK